MSRPQRRKEADRLRRLNRITAVALLPLAAAAIIGYATTTSVDELTDSAAGEGLLKNQLDPNTAPWWELTSLPGIGETRAKAIVEHRVRALERSGVSSAIVFQHAADLEAVYGIGPKTVTRIAPHLAFPPE